MSNMYIAVNKNIDMSKGKMAGQVAHAVVNYIAKYGIDKDWYKNGTTQAKIILECSQGMLENLEKLSYSCVRDSGKTELDEGTITCVVLGIFENKDELAKVNKKFKRLQLYKER